jgi:death-on-curing protein
VKNKPIQFLSLLEVLAIHQTTIEQEGGAYGIREPGLLESAVEMPQASFGGEYLHVDLAEMAAAYLYHICMNHAFVDGNKRAALVSAGVFLDANGVTEENMPTVAEFEVFTLKVANGLVMKPEIAQFFRDKGILREVKR